MTSIAAWSALRDRLDLLSCTRHNRHNQELTEAAPNFSGFALHEQIDAVMLLLQYEEERVLELLEFLIGATGHGDTLAFATGRLLLDKMLDVVIIDVVC